MGAMRVLSVGLNPTLQRTIQVATTLPNGVNRALDARHDVAGKGANVARVLGQLDVPVRHLSHAGGDNRDVWLSGCRSDGIDVVAPAAPGAVRTCVTILERDTGSATEFIEPAPEVDAETVRAVRDAFDQELAGSSVLVIAGSMAPGYPRDTYLEMIDGARRRGIGVAVDVSGAVLRDVVRRRPDFLKVNVREFGTTFTPELADQLAELESRSRSILDMEDVREKFRRVLVRLAQEGTAVVLSQGARPTVVVDPEREELVGIDTIPLDPVNTIGCGDTMTAALVSRYFAADVPLAGHELVEAVDYAHTLAAINASLMKPGTIRE